MEGKKEEAKDGEGKKDEVLIPGRRVGEEGNGKQRSGSPSLAEALSGKTSVLGKAGSRIGGGPRRTLSMIPVVNKKQWEEEDRKLQQHMGVATQWHVPFEKLLLGDELGRGTFKVVYRGTYLETPVAIAEIIGVKRSDFLNVENELRIMQHIRHPNALLFIGVSYDNDKFYIVTELAPLGTLEDLLKERGKALTWRCKIRMAEEIAHALAYLHDRGVYHRDLKAENVLVFPGDNDGFLLKLADFGLGFLTTSSSLLAQSQVGTVWIRAPEVDSEPAYDPAAVDVFSLGMVLVDLLTDGGGEELRWDVAYQKKDPVTGKNLLSFGLNTDQLREILSRKPRRPPGLIALAVECASEDPTRRPALAVISQRLAVLLQRFTESENVRAHLQQQLALRESQALAASAAIKSTEGMEVWALVTRNLNVKAVPAAELWQRCLQLFEPFGDPLSQSEADVLAEAVGYAEEGKVDAPLFAHLWERLEPVMQLFRHAQLGYLWRNGLCALLSDRTQATSVLMSHRDCVVLRISNTFPGKLTVSFFARNSDKVVHQLIAVDAYAVVLGKGVDCRTYEGIHDLFLYLASLGYRAVVGRSAGQLHSLVALADSLPRNSAALADSADAYTLHNALETLESTGPDGM